MQSACRPSGRACVELQAVLVDHDELAGTDLALVHGADQVERARLGREHPVDPALLAVRRPIASGRIPCGSRKPISFPSESATIE